MCSLLPVALVFVTCSFVSLAQQPICQSNGCDGCCVTSNLCNTEHTLTSEEHQCRSDSHLSFETPLIPGLQFCPFDFFSFEYGQCPDSHVDDPTKSVGDYGKPNWVGAEFQSIAYDTFSMMVMWEHRDGDLLSSFPDLNPTPVQGYEIRIYEKVAERSETAQLCFCVNDPSMRNISDIRRVGFTYKEMSHMIVEVRTFPSLIGKDKQNMRRNCSLLTGCTTTEECRDDCYSWPQSCLDFLPSYNPETCPPPLYNPPSNVQAVISLVNNNVTINNCLGQLDLSWEPPRMDLELFPVPSVYYIEIESEFLTINFKAVETTRVTVLPLNLTLGYTVYITAYISCSGLSQTSLSTSLVGCGNLAHFRLLPNCRCPTPPLHGWLGSYHSTSLHSTVMFQCDSGWSPSEQFITICNMNSDQPEWVPDPANHTCKGTLLKSRFSCLFNWSKRILYEWPRVTALECPIIIILACSKL